MREEHKRYILEHIGKKSVKEIAKELSIRERKIRRFLDHERTEHRYSLMPFGKKAVILSMLLIALAGFIVYANSLKGDFIWDDVDLVQENDYIKDFSHLSQVFSQDVGKGSDSEFNFYRPLQVVSYMLDYRIWKLNVVGYHLTNIILHILVGIGIYLLISALFKDNLVALLSTLLYIVHPLHTEVVSYIAGRADSLGALFMLAAFLFYIRYHLFKKWILALGVIVSFVCALLSKEASMVFPLLLLAWHRIFKVKIDLKAFAAVVATVGIYLVLRFTLLKELLLDAVYFQSTFLARLPGAFAALASYAKLLFLPFPLHMEYGFKLFAWNDPRTLAGIVIFLGLVFAAVKKREDRLVVFAISWFFITLLPQAGLYPINAYMAEHWMYLPSLGLFLVAGRFFSGLIATKRLKLVGLAAFLAVMGFYMGLTIRQNTYWQDDIAFYKRTMQYAPNSPRVYNNLGFSYIKLGRDEEALAMVKKAQELNPDHPDIYYNLGSALRAFGKDREAIAAYRKAVELKPDYTGAYYNLGNALSDAGKPHEAIEAYRKAIALNPGYIEAYNNLGNTLRAIGKDEEGIAALKRAIELNPRDAFAYNNLGNALSDLKQYDEAVAAFQKAIAADPKNSDIYYNLGYVYREAGRLKEAIETFKRAIKLNPRNAAYYYTLAVTYHHLKEYALAIQYCDKAVALGYKAHPAFLKALAPYRK